MSRGDRDHDTHDWPEASRPDEDDAWKDWERRNPGKVLPEPPAKMDDAGIAHRNELFDQATGFQQPREKDEK